MRPKSRLVSIWKEVLEVEQVGIRDNFFELGGHSLMAVRLFTRIQEEFGKSLPLMLLFQDGTVEETAKALSGEISTRPQGIVPMKPGGADVPLFIMSAGLYMRELALAMAPSRPVYGVNSTEEGKLVYRKSVQETARIYYQNLVDFYPQGPYLLLGHSAHGFFALEVARMLIENGQTVAFLGLLDTFPPGYKVQVNIIDRVKIYAKNFQGKTVGEVMQFIGGTLKRFTARLFSRAGMEERVLERLEAQGQVKEVRSLLLDTYKPEPFAGQVTILSATKRPSYVKIDPLELWVNTIKGKLEIIPIPGEHMSILRAPLVGELAKQIESLLPTNKND